MDTAAAVVVQLDPDIVEDLDAGSGIYLGGVNIHICGAPQPEWQHLRLIARSGGAQNYHELVPRVRYIVVRLSITLCP